MSGEHTPHHIAQLIHFLPSDSNIARAFNPDAEWNTERTLLAMLVNSLNLFMWSMGDKNKRGPQPQRIGPSYMRLKTRTLDAQSMPIDELMRKLSLERR
jgi:hypothetical protein